MTDGIGTQTDTYDDLDSPLTVTTGYTGLPARTLTFGYWPDGSRQSMALSCLSGSFSYQYDADGRLTGLTNPYSEASSWRYADNGWLGWQTLGDGAYSSPTLNGMGQNCYSVSRKGDGTLLAEWYNIRYADGAGNITEVIPTIPAAPAAYSGTTDYGYDGSNRLTGEQSTRAGGYTEGHAYDGGTATGPGNPTTFRNASRTFNADNQDTANTYDGNGNPTLYSGSSLALDPENRLTADGGALTAGYTGDGLRAWKQGTVGRTYFLYDDDELVCELDGNGSVTAVNRSGGNGLVSRHTSGGSAFYTFDPSGNTAQRLDGGGNILSSDLYDAFGQRQSTASAADVFGYGGQWGYYTDAETGLILCTHRFYDPNSGRFLNRDPIGYPGGINLYGYVGNDPVNDSDPEGTFKPNPAPPRLLPQCLKKLVPCLGTIGMTVGLFLMCQKPAGGPADTFMPLRPWRCGEDQWDQWLDRVDKKREVDRSCFHECMHDLKNQDHSGTAQTCIDGSGEVFYQTPEGYYEPLGSAYMCLDQCKKKTWQRKRGR